jgi:hypothetical protein
MHRIYGPTHVPGSSPRSNFLANTTFPSRVHLVRVIMGCLSLCVTVWPCIAKIGGTVIVRRGRVLSFSVSRFVDLHMLLFVTFRTLRYRSYCTDVLITDFRLSRWLVLMVILFLCYYTVILWAIMTFQRSKCVCWWVVCMFIYNTYILTNLHNSPLKMRVACIPETSRPQPHGETTKEQSQLQYKYCRHGFIAYLSICHSIYLSIRPSILPPSRPSMARQPLLAPWPPL